MAPNVGDQSCSTLTPADSPADAIVLKNRKFSDPEVKNDYQKRPEDSFSIKRVRWENVIAIAVAHCIALYGFVTFPYSQRWKTLVWGSLIQIKFIN